MSKNYDVIAIFSIYGQFRAMWKPDSGGISVKPIFSFRVTFYFTKTENRTKGRGVILQPPPLPHLKTNP